MLHFWLTTRPTFRGRFAYRTERRERMRQPLFAALLGLGALVNVGCGCHRNNLCTPEPVQVPCLRTSVAEPPLAPPPPSELPPVTPPVATH